MSICKITSLLTLLIKEDITNTHKIDLLRVRYKNKTIPSTIKILYGISMSTEIIATKTSIKNATVITKISAFTMIFKDLIKKAYITAGFFLTNISGTIQLNSVNCL